MKRIHLLLISTVLLFVINGCSDEEVVQEPTTTDISVTSSENLIFWTDNSDLISKIDNALTYNYGNALESEIEKTLIFNSDSTQVTATINFKQEFQNNYYDSNLINNSVSISLQEGITTENDFEVSDQITPTQYQQLIEIFHNSQFDINNMQEMYVPITFHLVMKSDFTGNTIPGGRIDELIDRFNLLFADALLNFTVCDIKIINNSDIYDIDNNDVEIRNEIINTHNIANTLNIYFVNEINNNPNISGYHTNFSNNLTNDFVVIKNEKTSDEWATAQHEVGHYFGLIHTHGPSNSILTYELVNGNDENRETTGDLVSDTAPDPKLTNGLIINNNCEYIGELLDRAGDLFILEEQDISNIMSYGYARPSGNDCRNIFTNGQMINVANYARSARSYLNNNDCLTFGSSSIFLSDNLNFGNIQINTTSNPQTLTISNTGNESFNVTDITSSNNVFTIIGGQNITIQPNDSFDVQIQFTPTNEQNYSGLITVDNDADNASSSNSSIQVTGTGVDNSSNTSTISLSGNLNFGNVEVGQSETRNFTISNTGNQSFNVSSISFPSGVYSANWNSGTINASGSQTVVVTFQPTNIQSYSGTVTVNHNADGGSNTIPVNGSGINNSMNQPNLIFNDYRIESDGNNENDIVEAGEDIDFDIEVFNSGSSTASNVDVYFDTTDPDITIIDHDRPMGNVSAGGYEWNTGDLDFQVSPNCPTKTVIFTVTFTSDEGTWNDSFSINIQGNDNGNPMSITPTNFCVDAPIMQVNTEYEVNINVGAYDYANPIDGESTGGNDVAGFWLAFEVPSNWGANHDVKIYDVSSNFDPVFGIKSICGGNFLGQSFNGSGYDNFVNDNGYGGNETSNTNLPGANNGGTDNFYYIRIYHYNGNETPNISFKIKVE